MLTGIESCVPENPSHYKFMCTSIVQYISYIRNHSYIHIYIYIAVLAFFGSLFSFFLCISFFLALPFSYIIMYIYVHPHNDQRSMGSTIRCLRQVYELCKDVKASDVYIHEDPVDLHVDRYSAASSLRDLGFGVWRFRV